MSADTTALADEFRAATNGASVPKLRTATAAFWQAHQDDPAAVFSALTALWPDAAGPVRLGVVMTCGPVAAAGARGATKFLTTACAEDPDWRVQEALAKGFDWMCEVRGWEASLPVIDEWIGHRQENVRRAASEGPRVWTKRDYFASHPRRAVEILGRLRADPSQYVRKSVANAVSDISKTHPDLVLTALEEWAADGKTDATFVITNAARHLRKTDPDRLSKILNTKGT